MVYAVIDTNVFVAALLTKNPNSSTVQVYKAIAEGRITPLYHKDILQEYVEVLSRSKFHFTVEQITHLIEMIIECGVEVFPTPTGEKLIDEDDLIFYEVVMEKQTEEAYLVTGNLKHYPTRSYIVTPAEMIRILE